MPKPSPLALLPLQKSVKTKKCSCGKLEKIQYPVVAPPFSGNTRRLNRELVYKNKTTGRAAKRTKENMQLDDIYDGDGLAVYER